MSRTGERDHDRFKVPRGSSLGSYAIAGFEELDARYSLDRHPLLCPIVTS